MKAIVLLLFGAALHFSSLAQDSFFSELIKSGSGLNPLLSITEDIDQKQYQVLTYLENNSSYETKMTIYDSMMVQQTAASHSWKKGTNDKVIFLGSAFFQKKHYSFFSIITESSLQNELVAIENDNGKVELKNLDKFEIKSITNTGTYKVSFSPNYKTILVMKEPLVDKTKNESVQFLVLDPKLNKITDLSLTFSVMSKPNPVNKAFVTDRGDVYVIKKDREKNDYKFYLYAYNAELKGWNQKQVNIPGKKVSDIDACMNSSQEFIVAGFYNTLDVSSYEGYFYYRFDASMKFIAKVNQRFTPEFMTDFIGKKSASKDDAVISGYYFENLIGAPDNNCYIIAEIEEYDNSTGAEKYNYGDIMYLHVDQDGKLKNSGCLKNKQQTVGDEGEWSSFNYAAVKDTLHLFHNEVNPSDSKSKFTDATFAGTYHSRLIKGSSATTVAEPQMIFQGDDKLAFYPEYVYHTSDNHLIYLLLSKDKMNFAIGKLKLK